MRNIIVLSCILICLSVKSKAQNTENLYPVSAHWEGRLANHQTTHMPKKNQTSIFIVHYFSSITENGISDLLGIYGSANIQMGVERGFGKDFSAWFLTEKVNKTQELGTRYRLLQQGRDGNPFSLAAAFSLGIDGRPEKVFGANYYFIDRFFYTTQFVASKKINPFWQVMLNSTLVHFNIVPDDSFSTFLALNPSVLAKVSRKVALFTSMDLPVGIASAAESTPQKAKSLLTIGAIIKTPTHNFQLFVSNSSQIVPGKDYINNHGGLDMDAFRFGFNIHVKI